MNNMDYKFNNIASIYYYRLRSNILIGYNKQQYITNIGYIDHSYFKYMLINIILNVDNNLNENSSNCHFEYDGLNHIFKVIDITINCKDLNYSDIFNYLNLELNRILDYDIKNKKEYEVNILTKISSGSNTLGKIINSIFISNEIILIDDILLMINRLGKLELKLLIEYMSFKFNLLLDPYNIEKFICKKIATHNNRIKLNEESIKNNYVSIKCPELKLDF